MPGARLNLPPTILNKSPNNNVQLAPLTGERDYSNDRYLSNNRDNTPPLN